MERQQYAGEKLENAVYMMMTMSSSNLLAREHLRAVVLHDLNTLREDDLPEGALRESFHDIMARITSFAPQHTASGLSGGAFVLMPDDDLMWIVTHLHALAFGIAQHLGSKRPGAHRLACRPKG